MTEGSSETEDSKKLSNVRKAELKPRRGTNARNGHSRKTVHTETGSVEVLALYARGMTTRDIYAHLRELYGTDVSHELISKATEHVIDDMLGRQLELSPLRLQREQLGV